jgi:hypothetical protein
VRGLITEAESGQRGFLLTVREDYLEPYQDALERLPGALDGLQSPTADNPRERDNMKRLRQAIQSKLNELGASVTLARLGKMADALTVLRGDTGRRDMLRIRSVLESMTAEEDRLLAARAGDASSISAASLCDACCTSARIAGRWRCSGMRPAPTMPSGGRKGVPPRSTALFASFASRARCKVRGRFCKTPWSNWRLFERRYGNGDSARLTAMRLTSGRSARPSPIPKAADRT